MALKLGNYYFDGPHTTATGLDQVPGVIAVIANFHGRQSLTDIRETTDLRREATGIARQHNQDPSQAPEGDDGVLFAAIYMRNQPDVERQRIVREFHDQFNLPAALPDTDHASR